MNASTIVRALVVMGCLSLVLPGAALSASFGEIAGGVKNMTEAAKDVNDIKQSNSGQQRRQAAPQHQAAPQKKAEKKQPQKQPKKQERRAAPQNERVRGG